MPRFVISILDGNVKLKIPATVPLRELDSSSETDLLSVVRCVAEILNGRRTIVDCTINVDEEVLGVSNCIKAVRFEGEQQYDVIPSTHTPDRDESLVFEIFLSPCRQPSAHKINALDEESANT